MTGLLFLVMNPLLARNYGCVLSCKMLAALIAHNVAGICELIAILRCIRYV